MQAYSILYSYPSWDANYRPQRGVRVIARSEEEACTKALESAPQGSTILRASLSRREASPMEIEEAEWYEARGANQYNLDNRDEARSVTIGLYVKRESCDSWVLAEIVKCDDLSAAWENLKRFSVQNPSRVVRALTVESIARDRALRS